MVQPGPHLDLTWTSGKVGGALSFDGVDDYVDVGNSELLSSYAGPTGKMSIALWIRLNRLLADTEYEFLGKGRQWEYGLSTYSNQFAFRLWVLDGSADNSIWGSGLVVNQW